MASIKKKWLPLVFVFLLFSAGIVFALNQWNEGYKATKQTLTQPIKVTPAQTCKVVNNNSANDYFVPTKSDAEWSAFLSHLPSGLTVQNEIWGPSTDLFCHDQNFTQYNDCGDPRSMLGTTCCDRSWSPATSTVCSGTSFTQTSNCGNSRTAIGTKCCDTSWSPAISTFCSGQSFTQISNCGNSRTAIGTKCCDTSWSPATSTVCSGTSFTQISNCGNSRTAIGTKCCDTSWSPATSTVCSGISFTQTSNCGTTRSATGTKICCVPESDASFCARFNIQCSPPQHIEQDNCGNWRSVNCGTCPPGTTCAWEGGVRKCLCVDTTWSPDPSTVCSGQSFTQTSNCGNTRSATGTKYCPVCRWVPVHTFGPVNCRSTPLWDWTGGVCACGSSPANAWRCTMGGPCSPGQWACQMGTYECRIW